MKHIRRLFCVALVAALLIVTAAPAFAAVSVDTSNATLYLSSTSGGYGSHGWINIDGTKSTTKITSIKSDKPSVASVYGLYNYNNSYTYFDENTTENYNSSEITVEPHKAGTATISFKVDGKSYSKKYTVLNYTNPVKSFKLTGYSSADLKSKFAKEAYVGEKLKSKAKAGYLQVTAASGWKITRAEWTKQSGGYESYEYYSSNGASSVKLAVPEMKTKTEYYIYLTLRNTKTGGTIGLSYNFYE